MNIINNRYKVLKFIKQNKFASSYLVYDLHLQDKVMLNIINYEKVPKSLIDFYMNEFINWTNINNFRINKVYDFDILNLIDNKKVKDIKYLYTNGYYEINKCFKDIIFKLDKEESILDTFIKLCEALDYLHLKGFTYNELNFENVCIYGGDIKLKDIPTVKLEKINGYKNKSFNLNKIKNFNEHIQYDIKSLGIMLFYLCITNHVDFTDDIFRGNNVNIKPNLSNEFINNIEKIIEKCITNKDGYDSIRDIVKDINYTLHKSYSFEQISEIKKINLNFKLVGREEETNLITEDYKSILSDNSEDKIVLVHGDTGIGKTKFLNNIRNALTYNRANVYASFFSSNRASNPFKEILKQILAESDSQILEKYGEDLIEFIPEIHYRHNLKDPYSLDISKERLKLLNRITGFINDFTKYKSIVIIIDDIHLADDFSIQLLTYLCNRRVKNKSILIVLSYSDGHHVLNKDTYKFISNIKNKNNIRNLRLKGLSKYQTGEMIKYILGMYKLPKEFCNIIYHKSYGNPLFIKEVLKNFYYKGIIYLNTKTGDWDTDYDYYEFPIPSDINQILLNQIKDIDEISYNILSTISIFLSPISIENIIFMSGYLREDIECRIENMVDRGLLCKKIEDQGFVYDFYNKLLKDLIYEKISKEDSKDKHKLASTFIEDQYSKGYDQYVEELIYHLQKSNQSIKVVEYCIRNAEKMKKFNNYIEAIKNLKSALEVLEENNIKQNKLEIIKRIAGLYVQIGEFNQAIKYLNDLENVAKELSNIKYQVYSLNKKAAIYCDKSNLENLKKCVGHLSKIVDKDKNLQGYLQYKLTLAKLYCFEEKYEQAKNICLNSISICNESYGSYKGYFCNLLSYIFITTSRPKKAQEFLNQSINIFTKINDLEGLVDALNNMGIVYANYYQDMVTASKYYKKAADICKNNNFIIREILSNYYLGEVYYNEQDYNHALVHFQKVEENSTQYDLGSNLFYSYIFLCKIYLRMGNYKKAYEYYNLCNKELKSRVICGTGLLQYYKVCSELHLELGNLEIAEDFIKKSLSYNNKDGSLLKINNEFLLKYIDLLNSTGCEKSYILKEIKLILSKISNVSLRIIFLCKLDWLLYHKKMYAEGKEVLENIKNTAQYINNLNYIEIYIIYLDALYNHKHNIKKLNKALEVIQKAGNKKLESTIYKCIGRYYFDKEDYFNAFVYYVECCEIFIELVKSLPLKYKKTFIDFYDIRGIIYRLKIIKEYYNKNKYLNDLELQKINIDEINIDEISNILNFINFKDIMNNKYFMKSVKKFYSSLFHNDIHDIKDILNNMTCNEMENLNIILQYILYITMGTNAYIVEQKNDEFHTLLSNGNNRKLTDEDYFIINQCKLKKDSILISNIENHKSNKLLSLKNIKACMCIPIILPSSSCVDFEDEHRAKSVYDDTNIMAYVYITANMGLNNLSFKTLKKCKQLNGLIGLMVQNYKLNKIIAYDKLTGVLTRKYLEEEIDKTLDIASENNGVFSMIMFDLDHFKNINDKFGHLTGDEVLTEVCSIVKSNIRSTDICGRYGGEEFIILLKDSHINNSEKVAEKLRKKIEDANILAGKEKITISMGIVEYPKHGQWKRDLIEKVDQALYIAKENGRNQCKVWSENICNKDKSTNKLTGIITGNEVQSDRNVLAMVELIELVNNNMKVEDKIYKTLGRIVDITESTYGMLFKIEDNNIKEIFSRKSFKEKWVYNISYNKHIVDSVIEKKHGVYTIDWDNIIKKDVITGLPECQSLIVVPLIKNNIVNGVLYLSTSIKNKEFDFNDYNFVDTLAKIISNMI